LRLRNGLPKNRSVTDPGSFGWDAYTLSGTQAQFVAGSRVIDVGCGQGKELAQIAEQGCLGVGLDVDADALAGCWRSKLTVVLAQAEFMPFRAASFDGLICSVAIPYTDEARVMNEIGRILKPGARGYFCYHGFGYFLRYILVGPTFKMRFYGIRSVLNTWFYRIAGRRLSGFWGDTLYQCHGRLLKYYRREGLRLVQPRTGKRFLGLPVFLYHTVEKS
jgi:SAM-dependent methyltransferase